jgi:hypothetical protein
LCRDIKKCTTCCFSRFGKIIFFTRATSYIQQLVKTQYIYISHRSWHIPWWTVSVAGLITTVNRD